MTGVVREGLEYRITARNDTAKLPLTPSIAMTTPARSVTRVAWSRAVPSMTTFVTLQYV